MRHGWVQTGGLVLGIGLLLLGRPAVAVITRLTPLKTVLAGQDLIFLTKIENLDARKPSFVLRLTEAFKGKPAFRQMSVNLTGDRQGQKEKHPDLLLKRVANGLSLIVFANANKPKTRYTAFGYTNGTWFQMIGQVDKDNPAVIHWTFTHCEPYLRRTYKGTTTELRQVIRDGLEAKKPPPEPDPKEPPGLGPEVDKVTRRQGDKVTRSGAGTNLRTMDQVYRIVPITLSPCHLVTLSPPGPLLAVIPTFTLVGPLALLAALFPAVFGGLMLVLRRWIILLSVASLNSTIFFFHNWFQGSIQGYWWGTPLGLWSLMTVVTLAGAVWSWLRYRGSPPAVQAAALQPRRSEQVILGGVGLVGLAVVFVCLGRGRLFQSPWKELLVPWVVTWVGTLYLMYLRFRVGRRPFFESVPKASLDPAGRVVEGYRLPKGQRANGPKCQSANGPQGVCHPQALPDIGSASPSPSSTLFRSGTRGLGNRYLPAEGVMLWALVFACAAFGATLLPRSQAGGAEVAWVFRPEGQGTIISSPLVTADRVYLGATHDRGFTAIGKVYCLERTTGRRLWTFDDDEQMKPVSISSPCLADGLLYIGEGFHQDADCKLYCLEADTGKKRWEYQTHSHVESNPCVAGGKVFFGAGDDGVICCDARTGKERWHFGGIHVDTNPAVVNQRLYAGSGYGQSYEVFCLDTDTGEPLWRRTVDLPVWGSPAVMGGRVLVGLGNGDFLKDGDHPQGALLCLDARTGAVLSDFRVPNAVLMKPTLDEARQHIYFASRDRHAYCLDLQEGKILWKRDLGSPVVTTSVLTDSRLYVAAGGGQVYCLRADTGDLLWSFDVAVNTRGTAELFSSPTVRDHCVYFGAGLRNAFSSTAALFCLQEP